MVELRDDLLGFIESYVTMKQLSKDRDSVEYSCRNVIDMDIIELKSFTEFGLLDMEICHYLKDREKSDGMTVKFKFTKDFHPEVRSRVREAIFRKDIFNFVDKKDEEIVSLQIDTVADFIQFFKKTIMEREFPTKKEINVRQFIK